MFINDTFAAAVINQPEWPRGPVGFSVAVQNIRCPVHPLVSNVNPLLDIPPLLRDILIISIFWNFYCIIDFIACRSLNVA
jgi:hypothetical protein